MPHENVVFFFFNDTATTEIYTLSLHDALPIWLGHRTLQCWRVKKSHARSLRDPRKLDLCARAGHQRLAYVDRKSTRLNSSHLVISYAVFCLKKKKKPVAQTACPRDIRLPACAI